MSTAQLTQPPDDQSTADLLPAAGSLQVWVDHVRGASGQRGLFALPLPAFVFRPEQVSLSTGRIDLADFGCAHRMTAIAFTPGNDCSSVTLIDGLQRSYDDRIAELEVAGGRFVDLYSIGWAARAAAIMFNR